MSEILSEEEIIGIAESALEAELTATSIYERLAETFRDTELSDKLSSFARTEEEHARFWRGFLEKRGVDSGVINVKKHIISLLAFIYGFLGIGLTLKILEAGERKAIRQYSRLFKSELLSVEEKESVTMFMLAELAHEEEFLEYESKFRFFVIKIATIFTQTSGGLVIVISTAIGLAGVYENPLVIGITGLIVGLTGALNTVVGFYFFGRTGRQIQEDILERIKMTCECVPHAYIRRIEKYMKGKEYSDEISLKIAEEAREKQLIDRIIAEEEYGIKEGALGNPLESALYAGLFKVIGTVLPLFPFFAGYPVSIAIPISVMITLILLSIAGAITAIAAEVDVKSKVVELTTGGIVLSTLTYILGRSTSVLINILNLD
ncbi:MAG: VIT1/CCC1 transporter family protein [Candidatus Bathyarchaeota archaeon]|nr:MAG: VIT1/CCC1 transporter family protein [Candidatus Bathyarchaeota archaeon]